MDSIRFGSDVNGLTLAQIAQITINGQVAGIDASGFLVAGGTIPEPSTVALLAAVAALLGVTATRRHKLAV